MTADTVAALAAQLRWAQEQVPFYQTVLGSSVIDDDNAYAVLGEMPLLNRSAVQRNFARLWSTSGQVSGWRRIRTSGTTGLPLEVIIDESARIAERQSFSNVVCSVPSARRANSLFHLTLHMAAASRTEHASAAPAETATKWNLARLWQSDNDDFASRLQVLDGQIVTGMPSVIAAVAQRLTAETSIKPALIILSGEVVEQNVRDLMTRVFDCPSTALYTLAEFGIAGLGCEDVGAYHVSDDVILEIVKVQSKPNVVVLSSLHNRAMPLIRYVTSDQADWDAAPCRCAYAGRRFVLRAGRPAAVQSTVFSSGPPLTSIDFSKLFANLGLRQYRIDRTADTISVTYSSDPRLSRGTDDAIAASIRGLVGPNIIVRVRNTASVDTESVSQNSSQAFHVSCNSTPSEIALWLRGQSEWRAAVVAAAVTGSALSPRFMTRYSDIDVVCLVDDPSRDWPSLARSLQDKVAGLRVNFATLAELKDAPLLRARLLSEKWAVIGSLESAGVEWPARGDLINQARFWAQDARAMVASAAAAFNRHDDPIRTAWLMARCCIDCLRFGVLALGFENTDPAAVLARAASEDLPWLTELRNTIDVATEFAPPPAASDGLGRCPPSGVESMFLVTFQALDWLATVVRNEFG